MQTGNRGYTLMEMVAVMTIMSIVGLVSSYAIVESMKVYARTSPHLDAAYQSRLGAERMKRDIRDIGDVTSITAMSATALSFTDSSRTTVTYALSGSELTRNGDRLAKGVSSLALSYWKSDGTAATAAADVHLVEIDLTIQTGSESHRIQTVAFPRSLTPMTAGGASDPVDETATLATVSDNNKLDAKMDLVSDSSEDAVLESFSLSADTSTEKLKEIKLKNKKVWKEEFGTSLPISGTSMNEGSTGDRTLDAGDDPELKLVFKSNPSGTIDYTLVLNFTDGTSSTLEFSIKW